MSVPSLLVAIVTACSRRAGLVVLAGVLIAAGCGALAATRLGISTDTGALFSSSLPWRQQQIAFDRAFPQLANLLVAVLDGAVPEEIESTAAGLGHALATDHTHFRRVSRPDASPYLTRNALLFLSRPQLTALLSRTIDAQPFLGQLVADPSLRGLFSALSLLAMGVQHGQADLSSVGAALSGFNAALRDAAAGHPKPLSWENLLAGPLAKEAGRYRFVLAQPVQNYGALQPGGAATAALRAAAAKLPYVANGDVRVRITGSVALADEEFASVAEGALAGTLGSVVLITLWLFLAARSWRIVVPIVLTLLLGLLLTCGFAAAAIGTLNLISVGFAILFVGLAVDFAIQFSLRFRNSRRVAPEIVLALAATARRAGRQVLIAAIATAAGFLAFVPTRFMRRRRTRPDRGCGNAGGVRLHRHLPAGVPHPVPTARRYGAGRLPPRGTARPLRRAPPPGDHRAVRAARHRRRRAAAVLAVRQQPAGYQEPEHRGDAHPARADGRPADQSRDDRHPRTLDGNGRRARRTARQAADGRPRADAVELRAGRPAAEARPDRRRAEYLAADPERARSTRRRHASRFPPCRPNGAGADHAGAAEARGEQPAGRHRAGPADAGGGSRCDADRRQCGVDALPADGDRAAARGAGRAAGDDCRHPARDRARLEAAGRARARPGGAEAVRERHHRLAPVRGRSDRDRAECGRRRGLDRRHQRDHPHRVPHRRGLGGDRDRADPAGGAAPGGGCGAGAGFAAGLGAADRAVRAPLRPRY